MGSARAACRATNSRNIATAESPWTLLRAEFINKCAQWCGEQWSKHLAVPSEASHSKVGKRRGALELGV